MQNTINFNELKNTRLVMNTSNFKGGIVDNISYEKPVGYIKAYLNSMLANNGLDYQIAKKHFIESGITTATVNTQINLFKKSIIEKGVVTNTPKLNKQLKSINDLSNFNIVSIDDKIIDKKLADDDTKLKIVINFNNSQIVITE